MTKNNDNCPQTLATATLISYTETNSHRQIDKDKDKLSKTNCQRQNDALNQGQRQKTMTTAHVHRPL